jgi:hypothetical protein
MIPQALLDLWSGMLSQDKERTIATDGSVDASWEEIRQALDAVPADCTRDEWVSIGMALHWAGTQTDQLEQALGLWNEWSAQSQTKYPGEREIITQWVSFKPDKASAVKLGTLFHIAKQHGWHRPMPDASELFSRWTCSMACAPSPLRWTCHCGPGCCANARKRFQKAWAATLWSLCSLGWPLSAGSLTPAPGSNSCPGLGCHRCCGS